MTQPACYRFRVKGHLRSSWSDWLEGLTILQEPDGDTLLTGDLLDQAALHGILMKIRDLGLVLISVERLSEEKGIEE